MSMWALSVMVLLVLLAAGIVVVAVRRGRPVPAAEPQPDGAPDRTGRTVLDLVRDRGQDETAVEPAAVSEPEVDAPEPAAEPSVAAAEPRPERAPTAADADPVGPPWTRGFVDGVPVEGPPRPKPARRSSVDPALVARVTSVAPPVPAREDRPVERGIVSPAVADAVARAEARRQAATEPAPAPRRALNVVSDPAPSPSGRPRLVATGAAIAGAALTGVGLGRATSPAATPADAGSTQADAEQAGSVQIGSAGPGEREAEQERAESTTAVAGESADADRRRGEVEPATADPDPAPESADAAAPTTVDASVGSAAEPVPAPRAGATEPPRPGPAVLPGGAPRRLHAVPALATSADPVIDTPAAQDRAQVVTLSAVTPTSPAPRSTPEDAANAAGAEDPRVAEHARVDLALLRTLGFADPNPRNGASPVVDLTVDHPVEAPEAPVVPTPVPFRVRGRDQAPVADAAVALMDDRGREAASATADAEGRGTVTAPRPGGYVLVASADRHQPGVVAVRAEPGGGPVDVQLVRSSAVSGRVRDGAGAAVAATLDLLQDGELVASTTADAAGAYRFADLASGEYTIAAQAEGRGPRVLTVTLAEESAVEQDVVLPAGARL